MVPQQRNSSSGSALARRRQQLPPVCVRRRRHCSNGRRGLVVEASSGLAVESAFTILCVIALGTSTQRPLWPRQEQRRQQRLQRRQQQQIEAAESRARPQRPANDSDWLPTTLKQRGGGKREGSDWTGLERDVDFRTGVEQEELEEEGWQWAMLGTLACFPYLGSLSWIVLATVDPLFDTVSRVQRRQDQVTFVVC